MVIHGVVLDRQYIPEYDVGLWGFGTMQVLKDRKTGTLRACKTVSKSILTNPRDVLHRLKMLRDLQHPHICSVIDVLEDHSHIFIISEKCLGGDIGDWMTSVLEQDSWIQEQTIAEYIRQALIALVHSHSNGVYHRELQPSSLALTSKAPDAAVKVCDFGLLPLLDPNAVVTQKNPNPYTAPEILTGLGQIGDSAPDMWSIGAIAHSLLTGRPPYQEDNARGELNESFLISQKRSTGDCWAERSVMSRNFVQQLLQQAGDRPTAARALQHPWMKGVVKLEALDCESASLTTTAADAAKDVRRKLLCYMLAVLLVPSLVKQRDLNQFKTDFVQLDADRDGLVSRYLVHRLLKNHGATSEVATIALDIIDVRNTDTLDFCAAICANLVVQEFGHEFGGKGHSGGRGRIFGAKDLVPRMIRRFFLSYGDADQLLATTAGIHAKLSTPTMRDMERHAGVHYREILSIFADDCTIDNQMLVAELSENAGHGTPLDNAADDNKQDHNSWTDAFKIEGFSEFVASMFHSCSIGENKRRRGTN